MLVVLFLIAATAFESCGDAIIRLGLFERLGVSRVAVVLGGGLLLLCYGILLNLAPMPFHRVVGLYIAMLFVVWQIVSFMTFRSFPSLPVTLGGVLIVVGGLIVAFWNVASNEPN
ncbi:MAG TPA: hypothetical protein VNU46_09360 [Gemmatimonadaceae bacterium]|jgi:hypothetical protein|nr:hypothetical protein [Gemmatimonadaceae bacterium]